ncbi:phospholipase effector Tle1 domain-containing protein, partial [Cupriavidus pauculus]
MQDWFTDSHESFARTVETMIGLYDGDFQACATCEEQPWFSFFFDGTGNNLKVDEPKLKLSNVARLYLGHVKKREDPLINDFYYPGVGTPLNASDPSWWEKLRDSEVLGGGAGLGWDVRLTTAEKEFNEYLKYNHRVTRIDIAVFGFSRGATLARAFVNRLLAKCTMKDGVPHWP